MSDTPETSGSIEVVETLKNGFDRLTRRSGLLLVGIYFVFFLVNTATSFSIVGQVFRQFGPGTMGPGSQFGQMNPYVGSGGVTGGITLPLPLPVLAVLAIALSVGGVYLSLIAARTLASEHEESIPEPFYKRNAVSGVLNLIAGGIITGIAVFIGLILLVVPGIFLMIGFAFFQVIVSVEDAPFMDAISESWEMAKGNRLDIFLLGVGIFAISIVVNIVAGIAAFQPVLNQLVTSATQAFMVVFVTAVLADAYLQLGGEPVEA